MKFPKKALTVFISILLTSNSAAFINADAASGNITESFAISSDIQASSSFSSSDEAVMYIREQFKNRNVSFSFSVSEGTSDPNAYLNKLIKEALAETGKGTEGDYLVLAIHSYSCKMSYSSKTFNAAFTVEYTSSAEEEKILNSYVSSLLNSLSLSGKSNYEKAEAIYDYMVNNIDYSYSDSEDTKYSAYGALVNKSAVCQGYSQLLYRLFNEAGIPCRFVGGNGNGGSHAWNIAKIGSLYYQLDSTWDATAGGTRRNFFMRGTEDFDSLLPNNYHILGDDSQQNTILHEDYASEQFLSLHPLSKYAYVPEELTVGDMNNDGFIDSVDASMVLSAYSELSTSGSCSYSEVQLQAADVNNDNYYDSVDASIILSYYAFSSTGGNTGLTEFIKNIK